jgi:hypothetical protein
MAVREEQSRKPGHRDGALCEDVVKRVKEKE